MAEEHFSEESAPSTGCELDRRASPRQNCNWEAFCRPLKAGMTSGWRVAIVEVSREGVAMISSQRLGPGAAVSLELTGLPSAFDRPRLARIIHARTLPYGGWYFGCSLANEFTDAELTVLLG